ncbi:MAG: DoxX family protein [archaeon]
MENRYAKPLLRIAMSLVFLYFGFQQVYSPDNWISFVPKFLTGAIITANNLVIFNGLLEMSLGIFLLIGIYTRTASLILAAHLFVISLSIGFTPLGVRDFGLSFATLAVFLNGSDKCTLDYKLNKENTK